MTASGSSSPRECTGGTAPPRNSSGVNAPSAGPSRHTVRPACPPSSCPAARAPARTSRWVTRTSGRSRFSSATSPSGASRSDSSAGTAPSRAAAHASST